MKIKEIKAYYFLTSLGLAFSFVQMVIYMCYDMVIDQTIKQSGWPYGYVFIPGEATIRAHTGEIGVIIVNCYQETWPHFGLLGIIFITTALLYQFFVWAKGIK